MKTVLKYLLLVTLLFVNASTLNASCDEDRSNARLLDYQVIYTMNEEEDFIIINEFSNLDDNLHIVVSSNRTDTVIDMDNSGKNDIDAISFNNEIVNKKVTYSVGVYSKDNTCNEVLRFFSYTTDAYNPYSDNEICDGKSDLIELCSIHYDTSNMTLEEFIEKVENYPVEIDKSIFEKIFDFIKLYYIYALIPIGVGLLVFIIKVIILKRRQKNA